MDSMRFEFSAIDRALDPCKDFYAYACGGWMAAHPIPSDKSRVSRYDEMIERNETWTRELLEKAAEARATRSEVERQIGDDYVSCMEQTAIDGRGTAPLRDDFEAIDRALLANDWTLILAHLHAQDVNAPLALYVDLDHRSPEQMQLQLDAAGLGLRDRDDYLREDQHSRRLLAAYEAYLGRVFRLLGEAAGSADADAARVISIETALARATPDSVARREREHFYHPMPVADLQKRLPEIRWRDYFKHLGLHTDHLNLNVVVPAFLDAVNELIATRDRQAWQAYLRWHLVRRSTQVLPSPFVTAAFDFYESAARGTRKIAPRWKQCGRLLNQHLGEAVGQLFVREHFSAERRAQVLEIVESVRAALRENIANSSWMSQPTRLDALRKVDAVVVKIGHPDRWRNYSGLVIDRVDAFGNARRARMFETRRQLSKLGNPPDRLEWDTPPQTLDGYSTKVLNEIAFTAGILQRPFFDSAADRPLQFGALGAVAGHELIHLFDDQGRKYDADGRMHDWWAPDDARRYTELAQCFVSEYGRETAVDDLRLNGQLTLGENLADNGGLRLAYRAARLSKDSPPIDGFTQAQRFFLAWAQIRCENMTNAEMRRRAHSDGHSPGRLRVNVVVSNMEEFAAAFACSPHTAMARADRCVLW